MPGDVRSVYQLQSWGADMNTDHLGVVVDETMTGIFRSFVVLAAFCVGAYFTAAIRKILSDGRVQRLALYILAIGIGLLAARFDMPYCSDQNPCPSFLDVRGKAFDEAIVVTLFMALAVIAGFERARWKKRHSARSYKAG